MRTLLLLIGFLSFVTSTLCAVEPSGFAIDLISPSKAHLYVDDAWQQRADCLKVKVSVTADVSEPALKAYFYDADAKLLHTGKQPSGQSDGNGNMVRIQKEFERGRKYEIFFGIPLAAAKWKRAVIVFGNAGDFAMKVFPMDDLAKFDFPEKTHIATPTVPASGMPTVPAPAIDSSRGEKITLPEFLKLKNQFDAQVELEVRKPHSFAVEDLNKKYIAALDRALETAQKAGMLEDAVAIKADKEAIGLGKGVPASDEEKTPAVLKQLRSPYRVVISRLETERGKRFQPLQVAFARSLDALVTNLTKEGRLEDALAVKKQREGLAAAVPPSAPMTLGQSPSTNLTSSGSQPTGGKFPMKWDYYQNADMQRASGILVFNNDGSLVLDGSRPSPGNWKQTSDPNILKVTLLSPGKPPEEGTIKIDGDKATFERPIGTRYLKAR